MTDKLLKQTMNKNVDDSDKLEVTSQEKLASNIIALLNEKTSALDAATLKKLEHARMQAVNRLHADSQLSQGHAGILHMLGTYINQHRTLMSSAALGCAVLMAFLVTQQLVGIDSADQGDAFLLGSELPPEAYADKGFDTWLAQNSQR